MIAGALAVGTIGSFVAIVLANDNSQQDLARRDKLTAEYQAEYQAYQAKVNAQDADVASRTAELSAKYYNEFNAYNSRVSTFDPANITELKTEDLKVGEGAEISSSSTFIAYYIGWKSDGTIFDQSISDGALKTPIAASPGSVITGWTEGAVGMKVGGIRELTIPSNKAYGPTGSGDSIPGNTPLKFIIMIIETREAIAAPQPSEELLRFYQ